MSFSFRGPRRRGSCCLSPASPSSSVSSLLSLRNITVLLTAHLLSAMFCAGPLYILTRLHGRWLVFEDRETEAPNTYVRSCTQQTDTQNSALSIVFTSRIPTRLTLHTKLCVWSQRLHGQAFLSLLRAFPQLNRVSDCPALPGQAGGHWQT